MGICQSMFDQGTDVDVSEPGECACIYSSKSVYVPQCMHSYAPVAYECVFM